MMCPTCNAERKVDEFHWKNKSKGIRHTSCKFCKKRYQSKWYSNNKREHIKRTSLNRKKYKLTTRSWVLNYLKSHPCNECGEADPVVLEFHHKGNKRKEVGYFISQGFSLRVVQTEVKKCEVLCSNCHRKRTASEQGWYKSVISSE